MEDIRTFPHESFCTQCQQKLYRGRENDGICHECCIRNCFKEICADIDNVDRIVLLDVYIKDFAEDKVSENCVLVNVDEKVRKILTKLYELLNFGSKNNLGDGHVARVKYLLMNKKHDGDDFYLSSRAVSYLNNISTKFNDYSRIILLEIIMKRRFFIRPYPSKGDTLKITFEDFVNAVTISNYKDFPSVNDMDVNYIVKKLSNEGNYLFRGINDTYYGHDKIQSSNYRNNENFDFIDLQKHEKEIADKYILSKHASDRDYITALSIMRHLGHDVCFIDFTKNLNVGLYFACKDIDNYMDNSFEIGEIFYFDEKLLNTKTEIFYPVNEDFVIHPTVDKLVEERINAQKSVFVYAYRGYLPKKEYESKINRLFIDPSLKKFFLQMSNLNKNTIFPDKLSFFSDPENFKTIYKKLTQIKQSIESDDILEADMLLREIEYRHRREREIEDRYPQKREVVELREKINKKIEEKYPSFSRRHSISSRRRSTK